MQIGDPVLSTVRTIDFTNHIEDAGTLDTQNEDKTITIRKHYE